MSDETRCPECGGTGHYDYGMGHSSVSGDHCETCGGSGTLPEHHVWCPECLTAFDARDLTRVLFHQTHKPTPVLDVPPGRLVAPAPAPSPRTPDEPEHKCAGYGCPVCTEHMDAVEAAEKAAKEAESAALRSRVEELEALAGAWAHLSMYQDKLLVAYRTGRQPSGATLDGIRAARERVNALAAARAALKKEIK